MRFTRFVVVAAVSLTVTEIALTLCNGVFHMTSTPAALVSWFCGAVVSYVLSRWAWERKGKPDVLRETMRLRRRLGRGRNAVPARGARLGDPG
ncbi:MAG TPA: GtrA family protein, partial [Trebonia sp.]|nr:GtrA family protein [Trebonia sp.]